MIPVPLQPMTEAGKRSLLVAIRASKHNSGEWLHDLAVLWVHLGLDIGIKPFDSRTKGTPGWRKVEVRWSPIAGRITGSCPHALSSRWAAEVSTLAARLYDRAIRNRSISTQGTFQPLFPEG